MRRGACLALLAGTAACSSVDAIDCGASATAVSVGARHYCRYDTAPTACPEELPELVPLPSGFACTDPQNASLACTDLRFPACAFPDGSRPDAGGDSARPDAGCAPATSTHLGPSCADGGTPGCGRVEVPAGSFLMGQAGNAGNGGDERSTTITSAFAVDAYEVTVARFRAFPRTVPSAVTFAGEALPYAGPAVLIEPGMSAPCSWTAMPGSGAAESLPLNCVEYWTAFAFCAWDGGRLPSEAEWEYVARGRCLPGLLSSRTFPWGDAQPVGCDRAWWNDCLPAGPHEVGGLPPSGGVYDLAGNVAEWTLDWFSMDGSCWGTTPLMDPLCTTASTARTVRGGEYGSVQPYLLHSASRATGDPGHRVGFRCVVPID